MVQILGALLSIFVSHTSVDAADKIRIGITYFNAQFGSLSLAQKRGLLQEEGLQTEFIRINAIVGLAALVSGEIDYYTVIGPLVAAAIQGAPIKVVACNGPITV